jgi:HD-GYP domain-containing protein (c-di-GMP phosphodiesterase class II)
MFGWLIRHIAPEAPMAERARRLIGVLKQSDRAFAEIEFGCSDVGSRIAGRLGMSARTRESLFYICETWNGRGPRKARGEAIPLPARVVNASMVAEVFFSARGKDEALAVAGRRRGKSLDPSAVDALLATSSDDQFWHELGRQDLWTSVLEIEPGPPRYVREAELDNAALALADFAGLKSTSAPAHSRAVADVAEAMARRMRLVPDEVALVRRAALVHAVGLAGVPAYTLNKEGPASEVDIERLRLHPYYTERILANVPAMRRIASVAAMHHERVDGQGYPHRLPGSQIPVAARIVAVADAYQELTEDRPGNTALASSAAVKVLQSEVGTRFDGDCVDALAQGTGTPRTAAAQRAWPSGLTEREVQVLRLVAKGMTVKEIAKQLVVSDSTARHHLEHIYDKASVSSRAGAVMFAVENGLLN